MGVAPRVVVHDRDGLQVHDLDVTLGAAGLGIAKTPCPCQVAVGHLWRCSGIG